MYLEVDAGTAVPNVREPQDLRRLDVRVLAGSSTAVADCLASSGFGRLAGADVAWLDVAALRAGCGAQSAQWAEQFAAMIAYAAGQGWVSEDGQHVQAHIARPSSTG